MARDQWVTDTGLIDDFEFTVTEAYFATDARYNQGQTLMLHWLGTTNNEDQPVLEADSFHPSFTCGDGWMTVDGGKTAKHPSKENFNKTSYMGRLVNACLEMIPEGTPGDPLEKGSPRDAEIWVGSRFRMKEVDFDYGGEIGKKSRLMPVEFLGVGEATAPTAAPAAVTDAPAPSGNGTDAVLRAKLTALAKQSSAHAEFMAAALNIAEVASDDVLLASIVDESPSGFFATANG